MSTEDHFETTEKLDFDELAEHLLYIHGLGGSLLQYDPEWDNNEANKALLILNNLHKAVHEHEQ